MGLQKIDHILDVAIFGQMLFYLFVLFPSKSGPNFTKLKNGRAQMKFKRSTTF